MVFLSSLFRKKDNVHKATVTTSNNEPKKRTEKAALLHLKGKPDANGLYPSELVMLSYAEKYKINETNFPAYLKNTYEIVNPAKMLKSLQSRGFLEVGAAKDALDSFKLPELKEMATSLGIAVKGKKADIIAQLSEADESSLSQFVKDRTWKLTESGKNTLAENPYIQYFLKKHPYNVTEVGVDLWTVNKEFVENPKRPYRDIIYRQLNDQMNRASIAFQSNPNSGSFVTQQYCQCYRLMGLFIEEEGESYLNAADMYFQYIFKRINVHAGLQLLTGYALFNGDSARQNGIINRYYENIKLYPFHKTELLRLIDELGIEGDGVREALTASFKRANDTGIMTEEQAADFVILELSGEVDVSKDLADELAQKATKDLGKLIK